MIYLVIAVVLLILIVPAFFLCLASGDPEGRGARLGLIGLIAFILIAVGLLADAVFAVIHYFR